VRDAHKWGGRRPDHLALAQLLGVRWTSGPRRAAYAEPRPLLAERVSHNGG